MQVWSIRHGEKIIKVSQLPAVEHPVTADIFPKPWKTEESPEGECRKEHHLEGSEEIKE